ncbi:MAG: chemotaxis response regulator protein-glutamate methylesterase [Pseudomonadales bacterium]|nr:chemotaxis response regulator protein-glutamate methylesterase [Pseudomonadales bacterium]
MTVSVLVVDDSAFFRSRIVQLLKRSPKLRVVGEASNGREALRLALDLKPDLITMDYEMPVMDGITAMIEIRKQWPIPVIMLSSLTFEGARLTIKALEAGAADFLVKSQMDAQMDGRPLLIEKILALVAAKNIGVESKQAVHHPVSVSGPVPAPTVHTSTKSLERLKLLVVAASTGGPLAIRQVLEVLPATFRCPILVVQHMPERFTQAFAERLGEHCRIGVEEAEDGVALKAGHAYVAPGGKQLLLAQQSGLCAQVVADHDGRLYKPSVDVTLGSAAKVVGAGVLALVLTGMGDDGTRGGRLLHAAGGILWVQEASSCVVNGMPQSLRNAGLADEVLTLSDMGRRLAMLTH